MVADFCARLACGLALMMVCTSARAVGVFHLRTVMQLVLGLCVLAVLAGPGVRTTPGALLVAAAVLAFVGSAVATLGRPAASRVVAVAVLLLLMPTLWLTSDSPSAATSWTTTLLAFGAAVTSAALLGSMTAAMLLGHSYLISPTMSIDPLKRLVLLVGASVAARTAVATCGAWAGFRPGPADGAVDTLWWTLIAARWIVGLAGPAVVTWLVWQTAKIRSTQSATGILYVGVFFTFVGEVAGRALVM